MRRTWLGQLVLLATLGGLAGAGRGADARLPYAGAWEITILFSTPPGVGEQPNIGETTLGLIQIDQAGKTIELLSALGPWAKAQPSGLKAAAGVVRFQISTTASANKQEFYLCVHPPPGKGEIESMLGTVQAGTRFIPVRLEKTERTRIDPAAAQKPAPGVKELQAAYKTAEADDRIKNLADFLESHQKQPIAFFAGGLLASELIKQKAGASAFKPLATAYLKATIPFGREMQVQAHLDLSRILRNYDKTAPLALDHAEKAAGLVKDADHRAIRLAVFMELGNALAKNNKVDQIKKLLPQITKITDEVIVKPRVPVPPLQVTREMATVLLGSAALAVREAGLAYARKAVTLLDAKTPLAEKVSTHHLLQNALLACNQTDQANRLTPTIEKMEADLDQQYLRTAVPFQPVKYAGRQGKSDRVVLVETFTSANAPQVQALTPAVDALASTYSAKEVVVLQYHLGAPLGQPAVVVQSSLSAPGVEARKTFYEDEVSGVPTTLLDGKSTPALGGARNHAQARHTTLRELIDKELEIAPGAKLALTAARKGDRIDVSVTVSNLQAAAGQTKLFFVLAEDRVRYVGANGVRLHHNVVREVIDGARLMQKESTHRTSIDLTALRKKLHTHLNAVASRSPIPNAARPMELKKLKVVALVQDEDTKKVLQTAVVEVAE